MACKIEINDKTYSDILGQVKDPVIAMRLYLQDSSDNMISKSVLPAEKKVLNLIDSRLKKIDEKVQSKEGNKFILKDEKNRLETIKKQLKEELKEGNSLYFYNTAKDYLTEIEKAVEGDITEDQLKSYYRDVKLFEDFARNISDNPTELPSDVEISLRAKKLSLKLEPMILKTVLKYVNSKGFNLEEDDLKYLEEQGKAAALTLDLSSDTNLFMQYVNKMIKEATILRDFKLQEELKKIIELEKDLTIEDKQKIFKKGTNGKILRNKLITRQSDLFFKDYYSQLNEINDLREKEDWLNFKSKRRALLSWMNENTAFVNPQYFITTDETKKRNLFEELANQVGSDEYAQELIESATNKWNSYRKTFTDYVEYINNQEDKTEEQKKELIRTFQVENSPDIYYGVLFGDRDAYIKQYNIKTSDHFSEKYVVFAPKISKPEYYSNEYRELEQNKKLFAYYQNLKNTMNKYKQYLPEYSRAGAYRSDYIYRSKADMVEIFKNSGLKGVAPKITSQMIDAFTTQFEHEYVGEVDSEGKSIGSIPVAKLVSIDSEIEKLENILAKKELTEDERKNVLKRLEELNTQYTIDPSKSMEVFLAMALNYKFMSDISDEVELASEIVNAAKSKETNGTVGDPVNLKQRFNHHIKSVLYGQSKDVEGQHKANKDFQDNVFEVKDLIGMTSDVKKRAKELSKTILSQKEEIESLIMKQDSGVDLTDDEQTKINTYKALIGEYRNLGGKRFTWGSFLDRIVDFQALKTFGFNPISGISNLTFGLVSISTEANSGTYFNNKDLRAGFTIMLDSTKKYMSMGLVKQGYSDKITTLIDKFSLAKDVNDVKYNKNHYKKTLGDKLSPYGFMEHSDIFMKGVGSIAAMKNMRKWSLTTVEGKQISVWDAFDNSGNWKSELFDEKTNNDWNGDALTGGSTKLAEYTAYLKQINSKLHGNFDRNAPVVAKRYVLGRMIGQFKLSWMPLYFEERFGTKKYDALLNETKEGRYKTLARLVTENEDLGSNIAMRAIKLLLKANREGLDEFEKANLLKTRADILFYMSMTMLIMMLKHWADDDEDGKIDKENKSAKLLVNQLFQLKSDVGFALDPNVFQSLTSKIIPSISVLTDFQKAISKTSSYITTDFETDKKEQEGFDAMWKYIFKAFPFSRQVITINTRMSKNLEDLQKN